MDTLKVFVTQDGKATIVCPQCGFARQVDATRFPQQNTHVKVRCPCGHSFRVSLEIRKAYRKPVFLKRKSVVKAMGEVRRIDGKTVGVGFINFDSGSQKAPSFFLLP
ncbi:hypothetical protein [Desulfosoma sp.]